MNRFFRLCLCRSNLCQAFQAPGDATFITDFFIKNTPTLKPVDDFKNLRQEVLDLQKANRDLRKELDDLKKKLEVKEPTKVPAKSRTASPARGR